MSDVEFFDIIDKDIATQFIKQFGGVFLYDYCEGAIYNYGSSVFELTNNLEELLKESLDKNENLLFNLKKIKN